MSDFPPIPHPELRTDVRPGPVLIRFEFVSATEPRHNNRGGRVAWFGPFQSAWVYGSALMARDESGKEWVVAEHNIQPDYGGAIWHAQDDKLYTHFAFYALPSPSEPNLTVDLLGSLIIEDVKRRVREAQG